MSHFTALVAAKDEEELTKRLQPYHEYECTGIKDRYVVFVEATEDLESEYQEHKKDYGSLAEFAEDWHGYEFCNGKWGRWTNPNRKWDWWVIGGRWSGSLPLEDGNRVDFASKSEIQWQNLKNETIAYAKERYETFHRLESMAEDDTERTGLLIESGLYLLQESEAIAMEKLSEDEYVSHYCKENPPFFAWIDTDGAWHQKAKMGWFGMSFDKNENASEGFWQFIESLPSDQCLFVVDCHI